METNTTTQPNLRQAVPFFMVRDMEASLDFYVNKLSFTIERQWIPRGKIEWVWLQRDGVALMLQQIRNDNTDKSGANNSVAFQCVDALALYHEFTYKGVTIAEPFVGNNMWVVCFSDPDGFKLDFESPTDVAEETKYSEWKANGK